MYGDFTLMLFSQALLYLHFFIKRILILLLANIICCIEFSSKESSNVVGTTCGAAISIGNIVSVLKYIFSSLGL